MHYSADPKNLSGPVNVILVEMRVELIQDQKLQERFRQIRKSLSELKQSTHVGNVVPQKSLWPSLLTKEYKFIGTKQKCQ